MWRYFVGGLGAPLSMGKKKVVVTYVDSSCVVSPTQISVISGLGCTMLSATTCDAMAVGGDAVFQTRECVDDVDSFAEAKMGYTPFLIVESYANGTICQVQKDISMYAADGKCHLSVSST
ncbi:unnamed protein product [Phytophthora lilii]|uniref:Unnamed protein product n=1 Tax=Phytophthora lilii TaxID=2077276 RepID=A0A9W6X6I1_9STRA|nr:unnamed protein product [Phytophthora lilii]